MQFSTIPGWAIGGYLPYTLAREDSSEFIFQPSFSTNDEKWMFVALLEGMKGSGISNPNPSVGCAIVKDGHLLSAGSTETYKQRHAERVAIEAVSPLTDLSGATAYVTLEPCSHTGHQPPCMDLLIEKKITRVVVATVDPNPKVSGRGIEKLRKNGIEVSVGVLKNEAVLWHFPFLVSQVLARPVFIGKWAQSQEGLLASDKGESKWITAPAARAYGQWLRQKYDTIVVGAGTVLKDHPNLTARDCHQPVLRQPMRIIIDLRSRIVEITPELLSTTFNMDALTVLLAPYGSKPPKNFPKKAHFVQIKTNDAVSGLQQWIPSPEATQLFGKPIQSVFVEGGTALLNAFLMENAFDILHVFTGEKKLLGTKHKIKFNSNEKNWSSVTNVKIGNDVLGEYVRKAHHQVGLAEQLNPLYISKL